MEEILSHLAKLGFSQYEAKVYVALLRGGPQNGNELSIAAGVPSSKIYETLRKLAARGAVITYPSATVRYAATPPAELLARYRDEYNHAIDRLEQELSQVVTLVPQNEVLNLIGYPALIARARELINACQEEIYVSLWADELELLREPLRAAATRGARLHTMIYGDAELDVGVTYHHSYRDLVRERIAGRLLVMTVDTRDSLIAHFGSFGNASGLWTRHPVLVLIAKEYLRHDVVVQRTMQKIGFDEYDRWWHADPDLSEVILRS